MSSSLARASLAAILVIVNATAGCGGVRSSGSGGCAEANALLLRAGPGEIAMSGRATMDVNQYRVRGRFSLYMSKDGDVTLEYTSTGVMGGGREDIAFAYSADTLRVLDREYGDYYEGDEVVELVAGATERRIDVVELVRRVTARPLDCDGVSYSGDETSGSGRWDGGDFRLNVDRPAGRLSEAVWHFSGIDDDVRIGYRWDGPARLAELSIEVPARRWRIRLQAED